MECPWVSMDSVHELSVEVHGVSMDCHEDSMDTTAKLCQRGSNALPAQLSQVYALSAHSRINGFGFRVRVSVRVQVWVWVRFSCTKWIPMDVHLHEVSMNHPWISMGLSMDAHRYSTDIQGLSMDVHGCSWNEHP